MYLINPCCDEYRSAYSYTNKTMSENNSVVINWAMSSKTGGSKFLNCELGHATDTSY